MTSVVLANLVDEPTRTGRTRPPAGAVLQHSCSVELPYLFSADTTPIEDAPRLICWHPAPWHQSYGGSISASAQKYF